MAKPQPRHPSSPPSKPAPSKRVVDRWFQAVAVPVGKHSLILLKEQTDRAALMEEIRDLFRAHYVAPETTAKRLAELGALKTSALLREHLPVTKKARSGDLGEILATEAAEVYLGYVVPVRRLRWKDGRNMALRGDDIVGIARDADGKLRLLKGESKSRASLKAAAINEAGEALDRDRGRPTRHSVLFVAERLRDAGKDPLAKELEGAVLASFRGSMVEHLLFTVTGNDPEPLVAEHLAACAGKRRRRHAVAARIDDHAAFIVELFAGI